MGTGSPESRDPLSDPGGDPRGTRYHRPGRDRKEVSEFRPSLVINAAAYTRVDQAETEKEAAFAVNRDGTAHLAEAASRMDIPMIHISTDFVFDGRKGTPYLDTDPISPINVYGESKAAGKPNCGPGWPNTSSFALPGSTGFTETTSSRP
jgi:nucleoside-diphosphate-sugar epimerase